MADEKTVLQYKGRPLMRKDNMIYYGSMADSHIVMLQILETKKVQDTDIATRVSVELQLTDPNARAKDRIVKKSEKDGFFTALDLGSVWLTRALSAKNKFRSAYTDRRSRTQYGCDFFFIFPFLFAAADFCRSLFLPACVKPGLSGILGKKEGML